MAKIYNAPSQKQRRKTLRRTMPSAEIILWSRLNRRQLLGYKFRRQYSVYSYVLDFYCPERRLAIELDGDGHFVGRAIEYDQARQTTIEGLGITFVRFTNHEVFHNLNGVLETIVTRINDQARRKS